MRLWTGLALGLVILASVPGSRRPRPDHHGVSGPDRGSSPSESPPARTATSGSPNSASARSAGSRPPAPSPSSRSPRPAVPNCITAGRTGTCGSPSTTVNKIGRIDDGGRASPSSRSPRPPAGSSASRPARTATSGSPRRQRQDRPHHDGRRRHGVPDSHRRAVTRPHRGRPGRQPLVHREFRHRPSRTDHDGGRHHGVPDLTRQQRPSGNHGRPGRQPLVHRHRRQQDRPDHDDRRRHGVPDPHGQRQPARYRGRAGRQPLVRRGRANQIGRITPAGVVTEFPIPTAGAAPVASRPGRTATCGSPRLRQQDRPDDDWPADARAGVGRRARCRRHDSNVNGVLEPGRDRRGLSRLEEHPRRSRRASRSRSGLPDPRVRPTPSTTLPPTMGPRRAARPSNCHDATGDCYRVTVSGARPAAALGCDPDGGPEPRARRGGHG